MKCKVIAFLLCIVFVCTLCLPVYADSDSSSNDGYSAIISDIPKVCPTCGSALHAFWFSTAGAEVELSISDEGKVTIPAGAGVFATINLKCKSCGYEKAETRLFGLDWGNEKPGQWEVKEAPSGIGRKDLPGYADDKGTPLIDTSGRLLATADFVGWQFYRAYYDYSQIGYPYSIPSTLNANNIGSGSSASNNGISIYYSLTAPCDGTYYIIPNYNYDLGNYSYFFNNKEWVSNALTFSTNENYLQSATLKKGQTYTRYFASQILAGGFPYKYSFSPTLVLACEPLSSSINNNNSITINNNTWNGNIYTDNSTNLTYIYPQYTTINEKNETVTNISNTPIIYNNETKQYYTYDQTTKNYYYITYNSDPAPSPTPTPAPTDKPGGSISTPETGKPGGSSGSSWWDKLLDKIGNAVIDGLLGAVSAVLKLIFKLLSTILGWIIWAVSLVFTLFPFLPPGLSGLLVGGVVVCFVIGIIKFIRG